jgi:uncharacterized RDD family membrane protein YckC
LAFAFVFDVALFEKRGCGGFALDSAVVVKVKGKSPLIPLFKGGDPGALASTPESFAYPVRMESSNAAPSAPEPQAKPSAQPLIGWRLLSLLYDALPAIALWMLVGALYTVGYTVAGHDPRENIRPFSALQWLVWLSCWVVTGAYAVWSWRNGGQTLGMRPWRLKVQALDGGRAATPALWLRYAAGTASLLLAGVGFWWAWIDRERLTLHDRVSRTQTIRLAKP